MIINRHNYEELFLLYADNELSDVEKAAVENFVQQNADLAAELKMLKQATLAAENIPFEPKELLYKKENSIHFDNYEEYFLLSTDEELSAKENEEVEKFVLKHPELQTEYTLLKQTRLEPEAIIFKGREILYRKEEKERRIIFSNWMRISAAAAIVSIIAMTWLFTQNNHPSAGNYAVVAVKKDVKPVIEKNVKPVQPTVTEQPVAALHQKAGLKAETKTKAKVRVAKTNNLKRDEDALAVNQPVKKDVIAKPGNNLPKPEMTRPEQIYSEPVASVKQPDKKSNTDFVKNNDNTNVLTNETKVQPSTLVKDAVYREIDTNEDEEQSFYIGSAEINKKKLKGLFKKAASLFEKKSNKNDGGKTIQIAGFEIKSK